MEFSTLNGYKVKDKKAIRFYDTVDDMINDTTLKEGMHAKTKGYYNVNDGGASEYHITATESNSDYQEELDNGLYATLIVENKEVNVKQFGAYGDNTHDDTQAIQKALLLLNDYKDLIGKTGKDKDLIYYPLSPNSRIENLCKTIGEEIGLKVVNVNRRIDIGPYNVFRTPVKTWLSKIANAKLVVTSSFHGLTMCIVHKRQFVIVMEDKLILDRGSRVVDLLYLLNLEDRLFFSCDDVIKSKVWEQAIDYNKVYSILEKERSSSYNFLREIINL